MKFNGLSGLRGWGVNPSHGMTVAFLLLRTKEDFAMRIAFATDDTARVNASFETATHIALYEVGMFGHRLVDCVSFSADAADEDGRDSRERHAAIQGSIILYMADIDDDNAAKVVAGRIHPVQVNKPERIFDLLARLEDKLAKSPPPWLRKAVHRDTGGGASWLM